MYCLYLSGGHEEMDKNYTTIEITAKNIYINDMFIIVTEKAKTQNGGDEHPGTIM